MAVLFHMRLTRPVLGMLLVVMGLGVILQNPNRKVFISAGLCLVLCAVFFAACFLFKHLGDNEYLTPALAAWVPVLVFGPKAKPGVPLGLRSTLSDLGQTVAENFGCHLEKGTSFLPAIV